MHRYIPTHLCTGLTYVYTAEKTDHDVIFLTQYQATQALNPGRGILILEDIKNVLFYCDFNLQNLIFNMSVFLQATKTKVSD